MITIADYERAELDLQMGLTGCASLPDVTVDRLRRAP